VRCRSTTQEKFDGETYRFSLNVTAVRTGQCWFTLKNIPVLGQGTCTATTRQLLVEFAKGAREVKKLTRRKLYRSCGQDLKNQSKSAQLYMHLHDHRNSMISKPPSAICRVVPGAALVLIMPSPPVEAPAPPGPSLPPFASVQWSRFVSQYCLQLKPILHVRAAHSTAVRT